MSHSFIANAFVYMSSIVSLVYEIVLLPFTGGMLCGHQTSLHNWVIIKVAFRYLRWYLLGDMNQELDSSFLVIEKISLGPCGNIASERLQPCD